MIYFLIHLMWQIMTTIVVVFIVVSEALVCGHVYTLHYNVQIGQYMSKFTTGLGGGPAKK